MGNKIGKQFSSNCFTCWSELINEDPYIFIQPRQANLIIFPGSILTDFIRAIQYKSDSRLAAIATKSKVQYFGTTTFALKAPSSELRLIGQLNAIHLTFHSR